MTKASVIVGLHAVVRLHLAIEAKVFILMPVHQCYDFYVLELTVRVVYTNMVDCRKYSYLLFNQNP